MAEYERQDDFENLDAEVDGTSTSRRPDAVSPDYLTQFSFGPIQLQDPSQGILAKVWRVRAVGNDILLARANASETGYDPEILLFTVDDGLASLNEIDLAFQQNGDPVVVAERSTGDGGEQELWLYYFDALAGQFTFEVLGPGRTPRAIMDRPTFSDSEVLIFFISVPDGSLMLRDQLNDYQVASEVFALDTTNLFLEEATLTRQNSLELIFTVREPVNGTYGLRYFESPFYPFVSEESVLLAIEPLSFEVVEVVMEGEGVVDNLAPGFEPLSFEVIADDPLILYESVEELAPIMEPLSIVLEDVFLIYTAPADVDLLIPGMEPLSITLEQVVISQTAEIDDELLTLGFEPLSITVA